MSGDYTTDSHPLLPAGVPPSGGSTPRASAPCTSPSPPLSGLKAVTGFRLKPVLRPPHPRCTDPTDRTFSSQITRRSGYTLIELVSVTALAVVLIGFAVAGYHTWTRDNAVTAGQQLLQSALIRARSYALAHGGETRFQAILLPPSLARADAFSVDCRTNAASPWLAIIPTNALPDWVIFNKDHETNLFFFADGSCQEIEPDDHRDPLDDIGWLRMELRHSKVDVTDTSVRYRRALEVNRRTGLVREVSLREVAP